MSKTILPEGWSRPSGYSNGLLASGRWLAMAGQIGWDPVSARLVGDDIVLQTEQALRNILSVLRAAGGKPKHLIRLTWYVTDKQAYSAARERIGKRYADVIGKYYPAMTLIEVSGLLEPGACVEIEATAVLP